MMDGEEFKINNGNLGALPQANIKQFTLDKQSVKVYAVVGNQESYYIPTGMQGPVVKLVLSIGSNINSWKNVYSNDYLVVSAFNYTSLLRTLFVGSEWWVDSISYDTSSGKQMRYELTIDLYKKTDV